MGEVLIKAENVSKKFAKDLKRSLFYGLVDVFSGVIGKNQKKQLRNDEFWAVKNVSFEVKRGECLGLIGHNGAGKSTLLKILNGLISPDEGNITMYGKVGALIELGAGFNPILTGRENIYNNAAVIGFTKKEIDAKFDEILAFSELEEFINMPVQNYSSGMKVRLGFAIAAQMEPDVLLIDEVLAVGDLGFVLKCFKQIDKILPNTAVIFVSHTMPMVARIANQILLMEKGQMLYQGFEVPKGIDAYYKKFSNNEHSIVFDDGTFKLTTCKIVNKDGSLQKGEDLHIQLKLEVLQAIEHLPRIYFEFKDKEQRPIAGLISQLINTSIIDKHVHFDIKVPKVNFSKGVYSFDLALNDYNTKSPNMRINNLCNFQVESENQMWVPFELNATWDVKQIKA